MDIKEINGLTEEQIELVQKLVQSETDKVRTDYSTKLKTANDELAKFKPKEKSDTEKALEERVKAIEDREKEIANKERSMLIAEKLKSKGLPEGLGTYLNVGDDIDETIDKVGNTLGSYFLGSGTKPGNHNTNKGVTKAQFQQMSYSERAKLFQENNELYKALSR